MAIQVHNAGTCFQFYYTKCFIHFRAYILHTHTSICFDIIVEFIIHHINRESFWCSLYSTQRFRIEWVFNFPHNFDQLSNKFIIWKALFHWEIVCLFISFFIRDFHFFFFRHLKEEENKNRFLHSISLEPPRICSFTGLFDLGAFNAWRIPTDVWSKCPGPLFGTCELQ